MNTFKLIGFAGIASFALAISANSPTLAEVQKDVGAVEKGSNNLVHRVSHSLAAAEQYTGNAASGYKWGESKSVENWISSETPASGYKWGESRTKAAVNSEQLGTVNHAEQTRNPWGRKSYSEQARNPWGRKDFSEQARNPWGRKDFSEQARNPWGRKDFSEQARNPWGRKDFSEQARNPWGRK